MDDDAGSSHVSSTRQLLAPIDPGARTNDANENTANAVVNAPGFRSSLRGNMLHIEINNLPADLFGRGSIAVSVPLMSPADAIARLLLTGSLDPSIDTAATAFQVSPSAVMNVRHHAKNGHGAASRVWAALASAKRRRTAGGAQRETVLQHLASTVDTGIAGASPSFQQWLPADLPRWQETKLALTSFAGDGRMIDLPLEEFYGLVLDEVQFIRRSARLAWCELSGWPCGREPTGVSAWPAVPTGGAGACMDTRARAAAAFRLATLDDATSGVWLPGWMVRAEGVPSDHGALGACAALAAMLALMRAGHVNARCPDVATGSHAQRVSGLLMVAMSRARRAASAPGLSGGPVQGVLAMLRDCLSERRGGRASRSSASSGEPSCGAKGGGGGRQPARKRKRSHGSGGSGDGEGTGAGAGA